MANLDLKTALANLRGIQTTRRTDLYIVLMGLLLVVLVMYAYLPLVRRAMAAGSELGQTRQRLEEAQATVRSYEEYKRANSELKTRLNDFQKSRVSDKEFSELLGVLLQAGKKSGTDLVAVRPLRNKERENYQELPFEMTLKTRYQPLEDFLRELEKSNLLVKILKITASAEKTTPPEMEVTCKAVAFFVR